LEEIIEIFIERCYEEREKVSEELHQLFDGLKEQYSEEGRLEELEEERKTEIKKVETENEERRAEGIELLSKKFKSSIRAADSEKFDKDKFIRSFLITFFN
jgi:hypothetical protein